jgi:hypothetical protein
MESVVGTGNVAKALNIPKESGVLVPMTILRSGKIVIIEFEKE